MAAWGVRVRSARADVMCRMARAAKVGIGKEEPTDSARRPTLQCKYGAALGFYRAAVNAAAPAFSPGPSLADVLQPWFLDSRHWRDFF